MSGRRIVALFACSIAACTHPALARFQTEHDCASATIEDLGAHAYRVRGCGRVVNYVCDPRAYNQAVCIEERAGAEGATTTTVVDREDARASTAPRLRLEEGSVQGAQAVRLSIPHLGGAELFYAPGVDRENVLGRAAPGSPRAAPRRMRRSAMAITRRRFASRAPSRGRASCSARSSVALP